MRQFSLEVKIFKFVVEYLRRVKNYHCLGRSTFSSAWGPQKSWLTNGSLVYAPKCGARGGCGVSANEYSCAHGAQNSTFNLCISVSANSNPNSINAGTKAGFVSGSAVRPPDV